MYIFCIFFFGVYLIIFLVYIFCIFFSIRHSRRCTSFGLCMTCLSNCFFLCVYLLYFFSKFISIICYVSTSFGRVCLSVYFFFGVYLLYFLLKVTHLYVFVLYLYLIRALHVCLPIFCVYLLYFLLTFIFIFFFHLHEPRVSYACLSRKHRNYARKKIALRKIKSYAI